MIQIEFHGRQAHIVDASSSVDNLDSNVRFRIKSQVQLWPLIKNDPQVIFISLTKTLNSAEKKWA
jgi:hypothetical protein